MRRSRFLPWGLCGIAVAYAELPLESLEPVAQLTVLLLELLRFDIAPASEALERRVALPPVDPHFAGAVDRSDQKPQFDRQQLDVEQVDLDVPGDHDALVEDALEDVGEVGLRRGPSRQGVWRMGCEMSLFHGLDLGLPAYEAVAAL